MTELLWKITLNLKKIFVRTTTKRYFENTGSFLPVLTVCCGSGSVSQQISILMGYRPLEGRIKLTAGI